MTPYVTRLDMMGMSEMWTARRPKLTEWFAKVRARPSYKPQLRDWCPADLTATWRPSAQKKLAGSEANLASGLKDATKRWLHLTPRQT